MSDGSAWGMTSRALQAARMYHEGNCSLKEAARRCSAGYESSKSASELLRSGMHELIRAVEHGHLNISNADHQRKAAISIGLPPKHVPVDGWEYLYLIADPDSSYRKIGVASKVGVAGPQVRLNEAQRGNPRKIDLIGLWRFARLKEVRVVEKLLKGKHRSSPGGKEWLADIDWEVVDEHAQAGGGQRIPLVYNQQIQQYVPKPESTDGHGLRE